MVSPKTQIHWLLLLALGICLAVAEPVSAQPAAEPPARPAKPADAGPKPPPAPVAAAAPRPKDAGNPSGTTSAKVKDLLKQRRDVLREISAHAAKQYRAGRVTFDQVYRAEQALLGAELELAESEKDRLAVLERLVAIAKEAEAAAEARFEAGVGQQVDLLAAKASRLDAEIALERARLKTDAAFVPDGKRLDTLVPDGKRVVPQK